MLTGKARLVLVLASCFALGACSALGSKKSSTLADSEASEPASVAVMIKGKKSATLRLAVEELLSDRYDVVSGKRYRKAAKRLDAQKLKPSHVAKVAAKLGVDAVVTGTLSKRGKKRYLLKLRLRDGTTGKTIEKFTLKLRSRKKLRSSHEEELIAGLGPMLDEMAPPAEEEEDEDEDDEADEDAGPRDSGEAVAAREDSEAAPAKPAPAKAKSAKVAQASPKKANKANKPRKARAKKAAPAPAPKEEEPEDFDVRYDDEGQIIDDEVPAGLSKK